MIAPTAPGCFDTILTRHACLHQHQHQHNNKNKNKNKHKKQNNDKNKNEQQQEREQYVTRNVESVPRCMQGESAQINAATIIPIIATIVSLLLPPSPAQAVNRPSLHQTVPIDEGECKHM